MSQRIRVDTDNLKQKAKTIEQLSGDFERIGEKISQSSSGLNEYGGQLPSRQEALKAQSSANDIRD
jgi:hypothetical protein